MGQSSTGLQQHIANFIAYLFGWISGLLILFVEKDDQQVRFHGAQSVTIFGTLTVLNILLPFIPAVGPLLLALLAPVTLLAWIVMMVMSLLGAAPRVPIVKNFAEQLLRQFDNSPKRLNSDD